MQGNLVLAVGVNPKMGNPNPPPRGEIQGFSSASRRRLIRTCARLGNSIPIFVTLTYGATWPADPGEWKSHLATFGKRLKRLGEYSAIWRLEPQERGAPHYHLLVYQANGKRPFIPHEWVAKSWAEITNGDPAACSRVEALKSARGGMFYAAKYCAKLGDGTLPDGWERVGKHWGQINSAALPFPPQYEQIMHSHLEQAAVLKSMADAYRWSFLRAVARRYEDHMTPEDALVIAEKEWKAAREENEHFGNTSSFFGSAEDFLRKYSDKLAELEFRLIRLGYPKNQVARMFSDNARYAIEGAMM